VLGAALALLALLMGLNLKQEQDRIGARERERLLAQARVVQLVLREQFASLHEVLGSLARDWPARPSDGDFSARLAVLAQGMPGVRTLLVLDADGVSRASNRRQVLGRDFSHRDYFRQVRLLRHPEALTIGTPYTTSLGVYSVNVCRMIPAADGGFGGVVLATLDPTFFAPLVESVLYAPDMRATILHTEGLLFLQRPAEPSLLGRNLAQPGAFFARHVQSGEETTVFSGPTLSLGEDRLIALATISARDFPMDQSLVVTASREYRAIFAEWRADLFRESVLFLTLSLGCGAGLFVYGRHRREFERQQALATQTLAAGDRFLRSIADNIPGVVGYWDRDLRCRFANRAYREWFGRTPEEMEGIRLPELLGPTLAPTHLPRAEAALAGQAQHFERSQQRPDAVAYHHVHYIPDLDQGRVLGFFVLISDITEQKNEQFLLEARVQERTRELDRTVRSLELARDELTAANRVKDSFLAAVSHELRTPLNPILGMLQLALDAPLSPEQTEYLTHALAAAERLHRMIEDLIDFAGLDSRHPEPGPVAVQTLLEVLVQTVGGPARDKGLTLSASSRGGIMVTDLGLVRLILTNLAQNAVKFTASGTVSLFLELAREEGGRAEFRAEVADTGMGMDPALIPALLRGFAQAEPAQTRHFAGIGLGLAVVRRALEHLGGTLEVASEPGRGAKFTVRIPVEVPEGQPEGQPEGP
jgi:PAS domain S-box-containing protein